MLAATGESVAGGAIAMVLMGIGAIWLVSLAFFAVGRSEDRERERERAERAGPAEPAPPAPESAPPARRLRRAPRRRDHGS